MTPINVIKLTYLLFIFLLNTHMYSQEIKKEKIYILFKKNDGSHDKALGKKFTNEKGINFNLYINYFTNYKNLKKDTLCIRMLEKYPLTDESDLKAKSKAWHEKNRQYFIDFNKKYGVPAPPYDRNGIFDTYIIEKINDKQIVVYQVMFRNEGATICDFN